MSISLNRRVLASSALSVFALGLPKLALANSAVEDKDLVYAVNETQRDPANKARDIYRHPIESLSFWGLKPGMTIVEIDPGAKGWWVEILAPYAALTKGDYWASLPVLNAEGFSDQDRARAQAAHKAFADEIAASALMSQAKSFEFGPQKLDAFPAGKADFVLVARAFHNWARSEGRTPDYLSAFFAMLKPGGILAVEQHRAPEGSDPKAGTGYVPESYVISEAEKVGFKFAARSEINSNPKDTKDHPFGVWTLPPVRQSAPRGQAPAPDFDRAKYDAIGESDRMTLRFVKPI